MRSNPGQDSGDTSGSRHAGDAAPSSSPIASDEAFVKFHGEAKSSLKGWLLKRYPELANDPMTLNEYIADSFGDLYERRSSVTGDPFQYLINLTKNLIASRRTREMDSLDARLSSKRTSVIGELPMDRSAASVTGSKELRHIFSMDAIMSLTEEQRHLYDLCWVQNKTNAEVGTLLGVTEEAARLRLATIEKKLKESMGRYASEVGEVSSAPLTTRAQVKRAIEGVTNPARDLLRTVYVDGVPLDNAWLFLRFASKAEAQECLARGHEQLERKFGQKMPDALIAVLQARNGKDS